jgi:hypothetical protein
VAAPRFPCLCLLPARTFLAPLYRKRPWGIGSRSYQSSSVGAMDWRAHLNENAHGWARDMVELTIFRRLPGGDGEQLISWAENGDPISEPVPEGHVLKHGFMVPREVLDSLRDQLKPGPSERELEQLKEALGVERARLDLVLERLTPLVSMPEPVSATLESFSVGPDLLDRDAVRGIAQRIRHLRGRIEDGLASGHSRDLDLVSLAAELESIAGPA